MPAERGARLLQVCQGSSHAAVDPLVTLKPTGMTPPIQALQEGQELPAEVIAALFEALTYDALLAGGCWPVWLGAPWLDGWLLGVKHTVSDPCSVCCLVSAGQKKMIIHTLLYCSPGERQPVQMLRRLTAWRPRCAR